LVALSFPEKKLGLVVLSFPEETQVGCPESSRKNSGWLP
jgi:hypothetical protein